MTDFTAFLWIGLTVVAVAVLAIGWRRRRKPPP